MPVHKVKGGWRYGHAGHGHKVYASKGKAMKQARAIAISTARSHGHHIKVRISSGVAKRR